MSDEGNAWEWPTDADRERLERALGKKPRWSLWAARYERYRLMGPKRSVLAVYNKEREKAGKSGAKRTPGAWSDYIEDWSARAAAWDEAEAERLRQEREDEERKLREAARQTRRQLLQAGNNLLAKGVLPYMGKAGATPDAQTLMRLLSAIEKFNKDSRAEYGDLPVQRSEFSGPDGGPIPVAGALATVTVEDITEAEAWLEQWEQCRFGSPTARDDAEADGVAADEATE